MEDHWGQAASGLSGPLWTRVDYNQVAFALGKPALQDFHLLRMPAALIVSISEKLQ